jgi:hypothetical protein
MLLRDTRTGLGDDCGLAELSRGVLAMVVLLTAVTVFVNWVVAGGVEGVF